MDDQLVQTLESGLPKEHTVRTKLMSNNKISQNDLGFVSGGIECLSDDLKGLWP